MPQNGICGQMDVRDSWGKRQWSSLMAQTRLIYRTDSIGIPEMLPTMSFTEGHKENKQPEDKKKSAGKDK